MHYGVVDRADQLVHYVDVPLPGPRLPHDMAFTENYAILNDFPLFWEPEALAQGAHVARFHPDMPIPLRRHPAPRRTAEDIRWFEAESTYVLHFVNAYEDGDEIVLDGFFQGDPEPADNGMGNKWQRAFRFLALDRMQSRLHRWRLNLATGLVKEEQLQRHHHRVRHDERDLPHQGVPVRVRGHRQAVLVPLRRPGRARPATGTEERYSFGDGVYGSETAMAPRVGSTAEDDGYLVTLTTDMNADASYCRGPRRRPGRRRAGLHPPAPRAHLQRHPLHVGARATSCAAGTAADTAAEAVGL